MLPRFTAFVSSGCGFDVTAIGAQSAYAVRRGIWFLLLPKLGPARSPGFLLRYPTRSCEPALALEFQYASTGSLFDLALARRDGALCDCCALWHSRDSGWHAGRLCLAWTVDSVRGHLMKRILFGVAAIASTLGTSALAADLPLKAPPLPVAVYNWTGFYVGGNLGYSWGRSSTTTSFFDATSGALLSADARRFNMDGGIGGVQAGYNWQRDKWLFGVEADIQASGQRGDGLFACGGGALTPRAALNSACVPGHVGDTTAGDVAAFPVGDALSQKLEWFGTLRGRIGPTI